MERLKLAQAEQAKHIEEVEAIATTALAKAESNIVSFLSAHINPVTLEVTRITDKS